MAQQFDTNGMPVLGFDSSGIWNQPNDGRSYRQGGSVPLPNSSNNPLTLPTAPSTGPSNAAAYGGLALGGLLSGDLTGALQGASGYYAGQEGIEGALGAGTTGFNLSEQLGKRAFDSTQFKPFGVTSNLANVQAGPTGNIDVNLNPQQQAMQNQLMGQAGGFFNQVGQDPAQAQAALYEQMRGIQRPDEQRQRLALEERMLSQGRLGISSDAYGGSSPELLAQETAIQESMARANLGARQQALSEQSQAATLGGLLQGFGYQPQQQALNMFGSGVSTAELAQRGQQRGAELQALAGSQGVESYMTGANMANMLQQQQMQGLMSSAFGQAPTMQDQLINRYLNPDGGMLTNEGGIFNQGLNYLRDKFGSSSSSSSPYFSAPSTGMDSWLGGSNFYDSIKPQQNIDANGFNQTAFNSFVPQQDIDESGFNQSAFNAALGL